MTNAAQQVEIEELRLNERQANAFSTEADRLCRDLLSIYKCDFIIVDLPSVASYAVLEGDWRHNNGACTLKFDRRPSKSYKGAIAISLARLRFLHKSDYSQEF